MNDEDKVYRDLLDHVLHLLDHDLPVDDGRSVSDGHCSTTL